MLRRKLLRACRGKPLYFGEFGIGGGASQYCDRVAKSAAEAARHPEWGTCWQYQKAMDPCEGQHVSRMQSSSPAVQQSRISRLFIMLCHVRHATSSWVQAPHPTLLLREACTPANDTRMLCCRDPVPDMLATGI